MISSLIERIVRRRLGLEKKKWRKKFYTKYERWVTVSVSVIYSVIIALVGFTSFYSYFLFLGYCIFSFGLEAWFQKKYSERSREYLATIIMGFVMSGLLIALIASFNYYEYL
ncbi:DUF4181 domain-containing protein [Bacillus massiliigorillae]|uniref:DUF4181 domain-containing protein n=1 Tax=Bacillus massiliigorillae TaxID=1243664 RepID=UPI0018A84BD7|nr:DUF4181 domain-containing protein [Bacillus massiliigorillae]